MKAIIIVIIIILSQTESIRKHKRNDENAAEIEDAINSITSQIKRLNKCNANGLSENTPDDEKKLYNLAVNNLLKYWNEKADMISEKKYTSIKDFAKENSSEHEDFHRLKKRFMAMYFICKVQLDKIVDSVTFLESILANELNKNEVIPDIKGLKFKYIHLTKTSF